MAPLPPPRRLMRLAAAAGIAVLAVSLALLATGRRSTEPLPEHPGIAAGSAKLTYRAQAAEPLPLLRSPLQCRGGAGGVNIGRRLLAADWLTTPPVPGSLGPHWDQASCLACHLEGLPRAAASRRRPPPTRRSGHRSRPGAVRAARVSCLPPAGDDDGRRRRGGAGRSGDLALQRPAAARLCG